MQMGMRDARALRFPYIYSLRRVSGAPLRSYGWKLVVKHKCAASRFAPLSWIETKRNEILDLSGPATKLDD